MVYGRDASAAFLNPATAVLVDDDRLSFSVNFYLLSYFRAPSWYAPGPIDRSAFGDLRIDHPATSSISFTALPSSLCLFFRAGDVQALTIAQKDPRTREAKIGFCLATIVDENFATTADRFTESHVPGATRQVQTVAQSYTRFAAGPTYAMHVSNALAVGASIHGNLASHRSLMSAASTTFGSSAQPIATSFDRASRGDSFDFTATAGATYRFGRQTVGVSVQSPSLHVYGLGSVTEQAHFDGAGTGSTLLNARGSFVSRSPLRVGLGTGFEGAWGQAELDVFYNHALGRAFSAQLDGQQTNTKNGAVDDAAIALDLAERARGVVNFGAGVELVASPTISVLAGLSTDVTAVSAGALGTTPFVYFPQSTDRIAGSLGIGSRGSGGELLVGAEVMYGWGQRLAVNSYQLPPDLAPTQQNVTQVTLVVAGATNLRTLKRAVEDVRDILRQPPPKKPPGPE
jgi:hypothetical protein